MVNCYFNRMAQLLICKILFECCICYTHNCTISNQRPITQRRISDIIAELDMYGILNVKVISKGRYGRTREISLAIPNTILIKITSLLEQYLNL